MTEKQKLFCLEYIRSRNQTAAAEAAGYSKKTAYSIASENMRKPELRKFIQEKLQEQAEKIELSAENVLEEYRRLAFANLTDYFNDDGQLDMQAIKLLPREVSAALMAYEEEQKEFGTAKKIKLHPKIAALDALAKHFGLFEIDNSQRQPVVKIGFSDEEDEE